MNRRDFLATAGGLILGPSLLASEPPGPILTFSRNGITLPFFEHEMPSDAAKENIRQMFYELDENTEKHKDDCDKPYWQWAGDDYKFPLNELNGLLQKPFRWYGWFESNRFHLLQAGVAPGRFEYSNCKVCMFEREMYSGDGAGCPRETCVLPGPYECSAKVRYHQAEFNAGCDNYWTTTLPDIGCVVRWRYKIGNYRVV